MEEMQQKVKKNWAWFLLYCCILYKKKNEISSFGPKWQSCAVFTVQFSFISIKKKKKKKKKIK